MPREIWVVLVTAMSLAILWSFTIPAWHFPDEQAHFAQVQDYAEVKTIPHGKDVSFELAESTRVLGTLRNEIGWNRYTPTPGYQLPLSTSLWGYEEVYLKQLPPNYRTNFVKVEATRYPPLFYLISSFIYEQVIQSDIFTRLFITRLTSVLCLAGTIVATWYLVRELFPDQTTLQLATTSLVAFHPMLMFVSSGVNNDAMMNFLGTALIAASLPLFHRPPQLKDFFILGGLVIASIFTKQLLYLLFPGIILGLVYSLYKFTKPIYVIGGTLSFGLVGVLGYILAKSFNQGFWLPYWPQATASLMDWLTTYRDLLVKLYRETLVWYWGVYRWLGLVLPINLLRIIKLVAGLSLMGVILTLNRERKYLSFERLQLWIFLLLINVVYFMAITIWDVTQTIDHGFSHGLQGRYFFPLISTHMAMLVYGWWLLFGKYLKRWFAPLLTISVVLFNLYSLWYVLGAYYHRFPLSRFVIEISQYKPEFAKWPYLSLVIIIGAIMVITLIINQITYACKSSSNQHSHT